MQSTMERLQEEIEDRSDRPTTNAFQQVPRAQRSSAMPVVSDTRTTIFNTCSNYLSHTSSFNSSSSTDISWSFCRRTPLHAIYAHRSNQPEDIFRSSRRSCLECHIALCIFKLFGNLLPKGEKVYRSLGFERECVFCFLLPLLLLWSFCFDRLHATIFVIVCEILLWSYIWSYYALICSCLMICVWSIMFALGDECMLLIAYHFEHSTKMYVTWKSDPWS